MVQVTDERIGRPEALPLVPGVLTAGRTGGWSADLSWFRVEGVRVDLIRADAHAFESRPLGPGLRPALMLLAVGSGLLTGCAAGEALEVRPGQAVLLDTRTEVALRSDGDVRLLRVVTDLARLPDHLTTRTPVPAAVLADSPMVQSCIAFVSTLLHRSRSWGSSSDDAAVAQTLTALQLGLLAESRRQRREAAPASREADRRMRIEAHIEAHLDDPGLTPSSIARDFGISLRSVHASFSGCGTTVAALIRRSRIEAVQRSLEQRAVLPRMSEVAAAHGFRDAGQMARTFREQTGTTVREWHAGRR